MVWWHLILYFLAGALLGTIFFGGLWWTVQRLASSRFPGLLSFLSFFLRTAVVVGLFYLLLTGDDGGWPRLVALMIGFILARVIIVAKIRPFETSAKGQKSRDKGAGKK